MSSHQHSAQAAYTDGGWNKAPGYERQSKLAHQSFSVAILGHKHHAEVRSNFWSTTSQKRVVENAEAQGADERLYVAVGINFKQQYEYATCFRCT